MADDDAVENARVGYQAAIGLWTYEGQVIWARYSAMLVANSIVIGIIGLALTSKHPKAEVAVAAAPAGVILSIVWALLTARGFGYHKYWLLSAKELEARLRPVRTVAHGVDFGAGEEVSFAGGEKHRLCWPARLRVESASYISIGVFGVLYVAAATYVLLH